MTRPDISMTAAEVRSLIAGASTAIVAANGVGGVEGFVVEVARIAMIGELITIECGAAGKLLAALEDDPRVCVTFEDFPSYAQTAGRHHPRHCATEAGGPDRRARTNDAVSFAFERLKP